MPGIPPSSNTAPYDVVETILNFARVIANDAGVSIAGNLLADTQPYVFPMLNLAYRKLQDRLYNNAIESFPQEFILAALPAQSQAAFADPGIQAWIGFDGYNDGVSFNSNFALPQDMEIPLRLWERYTGQDQQFIPMYPVNDGLSDSTKTSYLRSWEWRGDRIYISGASQSLDLRIRYRRILPDIPSATPTTTPIPILRCAVPLAYLMVEIFAASRGSVVLPVFSQEKEDAIKQLVNQTTRKKQRNNFRRIPYSRRRGWW